jgi:hypothetical protein
LLNCALQIMLAMQSLNMHDPDNEDGVEGSVGGSGLQSPAESGDEGPKLPKAAIAFFKRTRKADSAASSVIGGGDTNLLHVVDKNSQVKRNMLAVMP